jgi:DNA-binding NtrC family response regulator
MPARILLIDDDAGIRESMRMPLEYEGYEYAAAASAEEGLAAVQRDAPDVVFLDIKMPGMDGLEALSRIKAMNESLPVVMISAHGNAQVGMDATKRGADDFIEKPFGAERLLVTIRNVLSQTRLKEENRTLRRAAEARYQMVGESPGLRGISDSIKRAAPTNATVLILGESGVGKELVARAIHRNSLRSRERFIQVNCAAIPEELIESELFGHEKGSFTGADRLHKGYFERASGGTLFLDEISEMPIELQVKLLRVLETNTIARIGGDAIIPVDVRVIAATNRKLDEAVANGKFREDLLYRLKVFPIDMPPLRERNGDMDLLAEHFLQKLNRAEDAQRKFTKPALKRLREHQWPGNVRELKNVVHRSFILAEEDIGPECVVFGTEYANPDSLPVLKFKVGATLEEVEKRVILATFDRCGGDKKQAAELLGMSLRTLYYRLNQYGAE